MQDTSDDEYIWSCGVRFPDDPSLLTLNSRKALRANRFEKWEHHAVSTLATDQDHVLELGGGLGFLSTILSIKSGVQSVTTLEPNPALSDYIKHVFRINDVSNGTVISAVPGPCELENIPFHIRRNVLASSLDVDAGAKPVQTVMAKAIDINALILERQISYLICDIEGGEADLVDILDPQTLRAVTIELHPRKIGNEGIRNIFDKLHNSGLIYAPEATFGKVVSFVRDAQLTVEG